MAAHDHIDAVDILCKLHILRETDMGQHDQHIHLWPHLGNVPLQLFVSGLETKALAEGGRHRLVDDRAGEADQPDLASLPFRSEEHTSELQSLMRTSYAVFCLK